MPEAPTARAERRAGRPRRAGTACDACTAGDSSPAPAALAAGTSDGGEVASATPTAAAAPSGAAAGAATRRFAARRDAILDAAARRFNAQGLKGATLADIAADVGLVTTSITYYYRRKEDLAAACFHRAIALHRGLAEAAAGQGRRPAEHVVAFVLAEAGLPAAQAQGLAPPQIEFNDIRALPERQATAVFEAYNGLFRAVRALLAGLPGIGRDDLNARTHLLLSAVHWLRNWLPRYEADDHPRVARRVAQLLLDGLGAAGTRWPDAAALALVPRPDRPPGQAVVGTEAGETGEAFLRAATELVNEQGYRGASVDRIAARLQLTKGAFYHHNDTKLDLISACFDRSHALIRHTLRAAEAAHGAGWLRACAATAALVQFQLGPQGPLLRASAISALPDPAARERVRQQAQRLNERLVGVLVDGMQDGSVRPHDPALGAQLLACGMNAAAELRRWVPGIGPEDVVARYVRPALIGLRASA